MISGKLERVSDGEGGYRNIRDHMISESVAIDCKGDATKAQRYYHAARKIATSLELADSIDTYLSQQVEYVDRDILEALAKRAIVACILEKEAASKTSRMRKPTPFNFYPNQLNELGKGCWYTQLYALITSGVTRSQLEGRLSRLVLVIFNYDRCLEDYLFNCLKISYDLDDAQAAACLSKIKIFHPYGKVGSLPWEIDGEPTVGYGADVSNVADLVKLSKGILTFNEVTGDDVAMYQEISLEVKQAHQLVFLGFGFIPQNMRLLGGNIKGNVEPDYILGTCRNLSEPDQKSAQTQIRENICNGSGKEITLIDKDCVDFMNHFRLTLEGRL